MKMKLKDLNPNPYKKEINKGKLGEIQIEDISGNLEELGFMGALPVVKIGGKVCLVNGHHRVEALKRKFGKSYEVEVTFHTYDGEQMIRGMVVENLSQRSGDFREESENIKAVEKYLNDNLEKLVSLRAARNQKLQMKGANTKHKTKATASDIKEWLKLSDKKWSHDKISNILHINRNISKALLDNVNYFPGGIKESKKDIGVEDAKALSRLEKKDQSKMKKIIDDSGLNKHGRGKLVTKFKRSSPKIKELILTSEADLGELKEKYGEKNRGVQKQKTVGDWILELTDLIEKVGRGMNLELLESCNKGQLANLYLYIVTDFDTYYKPFLKRLDELMGKEEQMKRLN